MDILCRLFGTKDPLGRMRRALEERRWADALDLGERLESRDVEPETADELQSLLVQAGDGLARLNLFEGEACLRAGERTRAEEHLALAAGQVRSSELAAKIEALRKKMEATAASGPVEAPDPGNPHCGGSCGGAAEPQREEASGERSLDPEGRYELILAGYPLDLAERYLDRSSPFRQAFLLAHDGGSEQALDLFGQVPEAERDDLYLFERGALLARMGQGEAAHNDLLKAVAINPDHSLCQETLVDLEIALGKTSSARQRLEKLSKEEGLQGFSHNRLAILALNDGDKEKALEHALSAIKGARPEREHLLLSASLLEGAGRMEEAEALLTRLSGGGCSGAPNVALAEFWLRQGKLPSKALEIFKGAARQDPQNPRWPFRMAEASLALGWRKDARRLLEKTVPHPDLDADLRQRGQTVLAELQA